MHQIEGINIGYAIAINIINSFFIYAFGMIAALKIRQKYFSFISFGFTIILGIIIGLEKLTYELVYKIIMSDSIDYILFPNDIGSVMIRFIMSIYLLLILAYSCKNMNTDIGEGEGDTFRLNFIGDMIHKFIGHLPSKKNYFRMYRNKDFMIWKIFSTILFIICNFTIKNSMAVFFVSYFICLITAFYFYDIYCFEKELFFVYFMSNYSYKKFLRDASTTGMLILGDNILLILFIRCFLNPKDLIILPFILIAILIITVFVNSYLYLKYPIKLYHITTFLALIILHLPIINLFILYRAILKGRDNWDKLSYEDGS